MADPGIYQYSLNGAIRGHCLTGLASSVENWQLIGQWTAEVGPKADGSYDMGQFPLGGTLDFEFMKKAVLMGYKPGDNGHYTLSGHDAGRLLDRTAPPQHLLPEGDADSLIEWLAGQCGVEVSGSGGLAGIDARALVTADKIADVIAELCQLSGIIPYIGPDGRLTLAPPALYPVSYGPGEILEDGGAELYLDDCAKGVCVVLYRRKKTKGEQEGGEGPTAWTEGETPGGSVSREEESVDGASYAYLQPLNVLAESSTATSDTIDLTSGAGSIQIDCAFHEEYDWDWETRAYWEKDAWLADFFRQDNQEHREFKYWLKGYAKTQTVTKSITGVANTVVREATTETMSRSMSLDGKIRTETYTKTTTSELLSGTIPEEAGGVKLVEKNPPFDEKYARSFSRRRNTVNMTETRRRHEMMEVGEFPVVHQWDKAAGKYVPATYTAGGRAVWLAVKANALNEWVEVITVKTTSEACDEADGGERRVRARFSSEATDGGSAWLNAKGYVPASNVGDTLEKAQENLIQQAYQAFFEGGAASQVETRLDEAPSDDPVQTLDLPGRRKGWSDGAHGSSDWFDPSTGGYSSYQGQCPHYGAGKCGVSGIDVIWDYSGEECPYSGGKGFRSCPRARGALEEARAKNDQAQFEKPILCTAGDIDSGLVYTRNVYVRDFMGEEEARELGSRMAANLLSLRGARGWRREITIPLDPSLHVDGTIVSVSHDYGELKTRIKYRAEGEIPPFLNSESAASMAFFVGSREGNRNTRSAIGSVVSIDASTGRVMAQVGRDMVECTSNIAQVGIGDSVLITLPAGNKMDGTIQERL
jgi:hypothetical protein